MDEVTCRLNQIGMDFPDIRSIDFNTVKNQWRDLPTDVSTGVSTMGLHLQEDYRSILTFFKPEGEIKAHKHNHEYEIMRILEGTCYDTLTNQKLETGDIYIIPKGQAHHIITKEEECYLYILFADKHDVHVLNREQRVAVKEMHRKKSKSKKI